MNIELNGEEAYRAAYEFLDILFKITPSDGLASLLGDMSTLVDGKPADPAFWGDWLECIQKATSKGDISDLGKLRHEIAFNMPTSLGDLDEEEAYKAMLELLVSLYARMQSDYLRSLLDRMSVLENGKPADYLIWEDWLKCIKKAKSGKVDTRLRDCS